MLLFYSYAFRKLSLLTNEDVFTPSSPQTSGIKFDPFCYSVLNLLFSNVAAASSNLKVVTLWRCSSLSPKLNCNKKTPNSLHGPHEWYWSQSFPCHMQQSAVFHQICRLGVEIVVEYCWKASTYACFPKPLFALVSYSHRVSENMCDMEVTPWFGKWELTFTTVLWVTRKVTWVSLTVNNCLEGRSMEHFN